MCQFLDGSDVQTSERAPKDGGNSMTSNKSVMEGQVMGYRRVTWPLPNQGQEDNPEKP